MKRLRDLTAVLGMVALTACNNASIEGSWVEPVPGMPGMQQGFVLDGDGSASSINMATLKYARNNEALNQKAIPAAVLTPAKKLLSVRGELVVGHEVRSFKAEGDSADYWIVDETGELMQKYDDMTKGVKNGKPVYVELEVIDMGKADDGFAADYEGVYQIMKINKIALK